MKPTEEMIAAAAAVLRGWTSDPDEWWAMAEAALTAAHTASTSSLPDRSPE